MNPLYWSGIRCLSGLWFYRVRAGFDGSSADICRFDVLLGVGTNLARCAVAKADALRAPSDTLPVPRRD
jgi:hypothetical protein